MSSSVEQQESIRDSNKTMNGIEDDSKTISLQCRDCGSNFPFTVGEQEFYKAKDFEGPPTRCKPCRAQKKASRDNYNQGGLGGAFGGQMNYMMMDAFGNPLNVFPYPPRPSALRTKPCHAFQRGECTFGANCRYYHDDGSQGPIGHYQQQLSPVNSFPGGFSSGFPGTFPGGFSGGMFMGGDIPPGAPSLFLNNAGGENQQQLRQQNSPPPQHQQSPSGGGGSSPRHFRGHQKRNPCFAFQRGECSFGDTCKYLHVDAGQRSPRGYCHAFSRGDCKFGDTCKFRHEIPSNANGL